MQFSGMLKISETHDGEVSLNPNELTESTGSIRETFFSFSSAMIFFAAESFSF